MKGWVYIITNKAMPGLVKVGQSSKDPELRAQELGNTGIPHPFLVEYDILIDNPYEVEQKAHKSLKKYREGKEWFKCSIELAAEEIKKVIANTKREIYHENLINLEIRKKQEEKRKEQEAQKKHTEEEKIRWKNIIEKQKRKTKQEAEARRKDEEESANR